MIKFIYSKIVTKMLSYFLITTFLMSITSFITFYNSKLVFNKIDNMFQTSIELNQLKEELVQTNENFSAYLRTKSTDNLMLYTKFRTDLENRASEILDKADELESNLILKNICNMSFSYIEETQLAVLAKKGRNIDEISIRYNNAEKILENIELYVDKLSLRYYEKNIDINMAVSGKLGFIQQINIVLLIFSVLFNVLLIIFFTLRLTHPIVKLSKSANEISKGNFDLEKVYVDSGDEISILANAFNQMTDNIKEHVKDIKEKAKLKQKLSNQEMQNLEMKNLLKDAELKALQSQINPHFLFNTLNAGMQIAMFEEAENTYTFMENLANMFRYNSRKLETPVTIKDEVENVKAYIYILKSRYGEVISFKEKIDEKALKYSIPCMILQPIVENAFIHGIGEKEEGGEIYLEVKKLNEFIEIKINDNGKGIEKPEVEELINRINKNEEKQNDKSHTTGIGLGNVYKRLNLFYSVENIMSIESRPDEGTTFILKIPLRAN